MHHGLSWMTDQILLNILLTWSWWSMLLSSPCDEYHLFRGCYHFIFSFYFYFCLFCIVSLFLFLLSVTDTQLRLAATVTLFSPVFVFVSNEICPLHRHVHSADVTLPHSFLQYVYFLLSKIKDFFSNSSYLAAVSYGWPWRARRGHSSGTGIRKNRLYWSSGCGWWLRRKKMERWCNI